MLHADADADAASACVQAGKVVVVTGTTSGTGFVCARTCARKGARVVVLNRESERSAAALKAILDEAPGADVTSVACDLSSFASVREAVAFLKESCKDSGIDVVACNAGVMALADAATVDGYDVQSQTNHLSHFLLVRQPTLRLSLRVRWCAHTRLVRLLAGQGALSAAGARGGAARRGARGEPQLLRAQRSAGRSRRTVLREERCVCSAAIHAASQPSLTRLCVRRPPGRKRREHVLRGRTLAALPPDEAGCAAPRKAQCTLPVS